MIELSRNQEPSGGGVIKVVGVGGAGSRAVDRLCREGIAGVELMVANADARALAASLTPQKIALGRTATRGLGAGGDPEVGRLAAVESRSELAAKLAGASLVVVVTGLGGGTGSGAAPEVASVARSQGALVLVVATMPFQFEGRRRKDQAVEGLNGLRQSTDLVVCFDNQRMTSIVGQGAGIEDAFGVVDALLAQVIRSLTSLMRRRNILNSGLDEVAATVAGNRSTALFGFGVADGEGRADGALARALESALLDRGHRLADADRLWIHVAGGDDMRWSEVQAIMTRASAQVSDQVRIFCGAAIDPALSGAVSVTILAGVPDPNAPSDINSVFAVGEADGADRADRGLSSVPLPTALNEHATSTAPENVVRKSEQLDPVDSVLPAEIYSDNSSPEVAFSDVRESGPVWAVDASAHGIDDPGGYAADQVKEAVPAETSTGGSGLRQSPDELIPVQDSQYLMEESAGNHSAVEAGEEPVQRSVDHGSNAVSSAGYSGAVISSSGSVENMRRDSRPVPAAVPPQSPADAEAAARRKETIQQQMKFEPVSRGRFEKTDPTIVDGEDLDVPTFLRKRRDA